MKNLRVLHLASFNGNIGDNANHAGFYRYFHSSTDFTFTIEELEIRRFYWKELEFDEGFVDRVNSFDLLIIGGGNYFELWVENSPTGTSIAITPDKLRQIVTPIFVNAVGVDPGQGASENNIVKFRLFLDMLIEKGSFISVRNDGSTKAIKDKVGQKYLENIASTPDAGFFVEATSAKIYYERKKYIAINFANDMYAVRFNSDVGKLEYSEVVKSLASVIASLLARYPDLEIILVPHIFRDLSAISDLLEQIEDRYRRSRISVAPLLHGKEGLQGILEVYKNAELVLANRFHANACSIGLETCTIGLQNYRQIEELYNELSSDSVVDISKNGFEKELLEKIVRSLQSTDTTSKKRLAILQKQYESFVSAYSTWLINMFE